MRSRALAIVLAIVVPVAVLGIVVLRSGGGSTHAPVRLPIAIGGGSGTSGAADAAMPYGGIVYEAAPGLPALDGTARAYTISGTQDEGRARQLADALGLHGDITSAPDGGFTVVDGDAQLTVYPYAGGGWSYVRQSSGGGVASSGTVTACPSDAPDCVPETTIPQRPANLPTEDAAKALVLDLLGRAGIDSSSVAVTVDDLTTQWSITVDPVVDGVATQGFGTSVTVGDGGAIEYASGVLGQPHAADEYPLLGSAAAIDLLNQGRGFVGPVPAEAAAATDTPATAVEGSSGSGVTPATAVEGSSGSGVTPAQPGTGDTTPPTFATGDTTPPTPTVGTIPPPVPQHVTITGADRILLFATSFDGRDSYLVPGYRFTTATGGTVSVLAISDSFLAPPPDATNSDSKPPDVTIEPPAVQSDSGGVPTGG